MDIYFCGSIRGGRDDTALYQDIVAKLEAHGTVLSEHVADTAVEAEGEAGMSEAEIYQRDVDWLQDADVVVAEVTQPSLGVGYELAVAEHIGLPVLCLFRPDADVSLSVMVRGNDALAVHEYDTVDELDAVFAQFFAERRAMDRD